MALWPFRRRTGRKRSRSGATLSDLDANARSMTAPPTAAMARTASLKKQKTEKSKSNNPKLQRRARTYSFSPGRNDSIRVAAQHDSVPPVPDRPAGSYPDMERVDSEKGEQDWQRVPTLHNHRHGQPVPRRKSSKRRREELDREAEIKAMANFVPVRPATDSWMAGRPMKKDSKRVRTDFGSQKDWEHPSSDISLPIPESIHSSMSSGSEYASYKVSAFDALVPRPTLRYNVYPKWGAASTSGPVRSGSQRKQRLAERGPIPEATLRAHKRVDSLADDLGAADLRELMERDKRRRERKQQLDQERIERRLARRAEKQREAEAEARERGTPPPQNLERGVLGRDMVGLGIDTTSAVVTSSRRRSSETSSRRRGDTPDDARASEDGRPDTADRAADRSSPQPLEHFHRTDSIPLEAHAVEPEVESSAPPPVAAESPAPKGRFLRSKKVRSTSPQSPEEGKRTYSPFSLKAEEEASRKDSDVSSRGRLSFSSLFRWGNRKRRSSGGPSSFSNTSREEMQAISQTQSPTPAPAAAAAAAAGAVPPPGFSRTLSSNVPKRTRSRFREDLPELPMSPPDSRMQSPELETPLPALTEAKSGENTTQNTPAAPRYDTPTSLHHSIQHSPQPHSVSLASIDSEGSWLSGRLRNRRSGLRGSISQQARHNRTASNNSSDPAMDGELAEDEYLSNLATPSQERYGDDVHRKSTGEGRPSSDEDEPMEEADMKWGSVGAQPKVVNDRELIKSREGLLKTYDENDTEEDEDQEEDEPRVVQRATSVNLGKGHARHISAGSAKLLEISSQDSQENRRNSRERRSSGAMFL